MSHKDLADDSVHHQNGWMKLDNAAKIYPPVTRGELTGVFRLTAVLTSPVKITVLQQAVIKTSKLFPSFSVELCHGIFWYYLEYNGEPPRVLLDEGVPCQAFPKSRKGEVMYRILARENRISVEFLHIITDGGGAMLFFKTLLNIYYRLASPTNIADSVFPGILSEKPFTETKDLFREYSKKNFPHPEKLAQAWHLPFNLRVKPRFMAMSFNVPADKLLEVAKQHNATITEFLTSVYLDSLQHLRNLQKSGSQYIRVQVPIDLRRRYKAETVRNFSAFVMPELDLRMGHYSFDEIIQEVKLAVGLMASEKRITKIISRNVSKENNPVIRIIPLPIKQLVLRMAFNRFGISQFSGVLTNIGKIDISDEGIKVLSSMLVIPPPPHHKIKVSCGVATLGNNTIITFGSVTEDKALEKSFIRFLTGKGIPVKLLYIN
jgi:NRPS condensation-like uncharacterized protein